MGFGLFLDLGLIFYLDFNSLETTIAYPYELMALLSLPRFSLSGISSSVIALQSEVVAFILFFLSGLKSL